jgi:hypothetical protein
MKKDLLEYLFDGWIDPRHLHPTRLLLHLDLSSYVLFRGFEFYRQEILRLASPYGVESRGSTRIVLSLLSTNSFDRFKSLKEKRVRVKKKEVSI